MIQSIFFFPDVYGKILHVNRQFAAAWALSHIVWLSHTHHMRMSSMEYIQLMHDSWAVRHQDAQPALAAS